MRRSLGGTVILAFALVAASLRAQGNYALSFGPDDFVVVPSSPSLNSATTAITIEAWVRLSGTTSRPTVVRRNSGPDLGSAEVYILRVDDVFATTMDLAFYLRTGAGGSAGLFAVVPLSLNTWHHFAGTFDGSTMRMYWDAQLVGSLPNPGSIFLTSHPLRMGIGETFEPWLGELDEIRLWNVARTQIQLAASMNTTLSGTETGLVGYWRFDQGSGQTATDSTPSANHGQLGSSPGPDINDPAWLLSTAPVGVGLISVSPSFGPYYATRSVTITGQSLSPAAATTLTLAGQPVASFTVVNPTTITAVFPPGPVGPANVAVATPYGSATLENGWTWANHLHSDVASVSVANPGPDHLYLFASPSNALRIYLVATSVSGTSPGVALPGSALVLPVNPDVWTDVGLLNLNTPLFTGFLGIIDGQGEGIATFNLGALPPFPPAAGLQISFAYAVLGFSGSGFAFASNPVTVAVTP